MSGMDYWDAANIVLLAYGDVTKSCAFYFVVKFYN